ncbi:uncharacterized protein LOC117649984 [Thrips palmi]|uniref:Uncharacterized protein LOC117649984 n=1 Tax=Thrips palmi TaxID=161013 RepID=A0A6P8ZVF1_THRPL|nr:uncharacterized protein LOC117649984 [Thrips palmi]
MTGLRGAILAVLLLAALVAAASAKPTIYVKNDNDKLEPVLVPVSSTVIPLPVYKVGFSLGATKGGKGGDRDRAQGRPEEPIQLITVHHKKKALGTVTKEKSTGLSP